MNLLQADTRLRKLNQPVLTTRDVASYLEIPTAFASSILQRLSEEDRIKRLTRGRWLIADTVDPFLIPEHLSFPLPAYVSLQSALYHHGMISQIPTVVYAVTLARTNRFQTPIGDFSLHHVAPKFFLGYTVSGRYGVKIATAEKALLDYIYLSPARSALFRSLPELELPRSFNIAAAEEMIEHIPSRARRSIVWKKFNTIVASATGARRR